MLLLEEFLRFDIDMSSGWGGQSRESEYRAGDNLERINIVN